MDERRRRAWTSVVAAQARSLRLTAVSSAAIAVLAGCVLAGGAAKLPPGTRECVGFPAEVCQRQVQGLERDGAAHGGVVAYRIVCTSGVCGIDQGEGTQTVVFADGTGGETGFGYAVPAATPPDDGLPDGTPAPLPVTPTCIGVPAAWCEDLARSAVEEAERAGEVVVTITVVCSTTCTDRGGAGETRIGLPDGGVLPNPWEYKTSGLGMPGGG